MRQLRRRDFIQILTAGGVGVLATACGTPAPQAAPTANSTLASTPQAVTPAKSGAPQQIQVGVTGVGPPESTHYIAIRQGFFSQEGLDVQLVPMNSGPELQAAVLGGAVSFAAISAITHLRAVQKNVPLKAIIAIDQGNPFYYAFSATWAQQKGISGASGADQIALALKGCRCAIAGPGGSTDVLTRVFLNKRNINPDKDLSLVTIGADGMLPALENNRVDAFVNLAPDPLVAQTDGGLAWSLDQVPEFHGMLYTTMVTNQSVIQQNATLVQGYVRALVNAWRFGQQNPDQALEIVKAASPGSDGDAFRLSYDSYVPLLKSGPRPTAESYQKSLDVYRASGTDAVDLPMSQVWDTQFLEVAMKSS